MVSNMINRVSAILVVLVVLLLVHLIRLRKIVKIHEITRTQQKITVNLERKTDLLHSLHLPEVSFYLYEDTDLDWYSACLRNPNNSFSSHKAFKHGDDIHFIEKLKNHPWRTKNPEKAKIFVLPFILSYLIRHQNCNKYTYDNIVENLQEYSHGKTYSWTRKVGGVQEYAVSYLTSLAWSNNFTYFERNQGRDHLIVASDFAIHYPNLMSKRFKKLIGNFSFGHFEFLPNIRFNGVVNGNRYNFEGGMNFVEYSEKPPWRCTIVVPYVDKSNKFEKITYSEWKSREIDFFFIGQIDSRRSYKLRTDVNELFLTNSTLRENSTFIFASSKSPERKSGFPHIHMKPIPVCNSSCFENFNQQSSPKCSNCFTEKAHYTSLLQKSKFCLVLPGDTVSSSRLYDAISSNCIPIVLTDSLMEFGLPFVWKVAWKDFVLFLPQDKDRVVENLLKIRQNINHFEKNLQKLQFYRDDVSWSSESSRIVDNILFEASEFC